MVLFTLSDGKPQKNQSQTETQSGNGPFVQSVTQRICDFCTVELHFRYLHLVQVAAIEQSGLKHNSFDFILLWLIDGYVCSSWILCSYLVQFDGCGKWKVLSEQCADVLSFLPTFLYNQLRLIHHTVSSALWLIRTNLEKLSLFLGRRIKRS